MSIISGDNITLTKENLFESIGGIIERDTITANSSDTLPSATDIVSIFKGNSNLDVTNNFLEFRILNNSNFVITLNSGTGITMKPGPTDVIQPNTIKRYTIIIKSDTTCNIYNLDYNGTPIVTEKIITNIIERESEIQPIQIFQNTPDVNVGAGPIIHFANSILESRTTSTSFIQKLRLTFTANAGDYIIFYTSEIEPKNSKTTLSTQVQIDDTTTIHSQDYYATKSEAGFITVSGSYVATLTAGSHNIDFDYKTSKHTAIIRQVHIQAMQID